MPLAVAGTTLVQLAGIVIALLAALASWATVRHARDSANEIRRTEREARQPLLLLSPAFSKPSVGPRTMLLAIHNVGDVAIDVGVMLIGEEELARAVVGFMRSGETVNFDSDIRATGQFRALVFARSKDGNRWVWNHQRVRRTIPSHTSVTDEWQADRRGVLSRRGFRSVSSSTITTCR